MRKIKVMHKIINRLHFITYQSDVKPIDQQVLEYCAGGGDWVQLRLKNLPKDEILQIASKCKSICMHYETKFIINDHVDIAMELDADGVHLGKNDADIEDARKMLGEHKIIGATANTFEDIESLNSKGVDYIGLGPYKFTQTKENLSPVLGLQGYETTIAQCRKNHIKLPIIAIGGILPEDIPMLINKGMYGIAISSYLAKKDNIGLETIQLLKTIGKSQSINFLNR